MAAAQPSTSLLEGIHPRIGFGTAPITLEDRPSWERAIDVVSAAVEAGVGLVDTADAYCIDSIREHGYGERLVAEVLGRFGGAAPVLVATKVGRWRPGDGSWQFRCRPREIRSACERSLRNLGVDTIDLLQLHRPDPAIPLEESVGELRRLQEEGKIRHIGLSNVDSNQLGRAAATAPIASVQNALSIVDRPDPELIGLCERLGMVFLAHSPFGGPGRARSIKRHLAIRKTAKRLNADPYQVAIAGLLRLSPAIIPIPGTTRPHRIAEHVAAAHLDIEDEGAWGSLEGL